MENKYLPVEKCIHRGLYILDARNFSLGIYDKKTKGFYGIRRKFDDIFLFLEIHYDMDDIFGTAKPIEYLNVQCLFEDILKNEIYVIKWVKLQEKNFLKKQQKKS